MLKHPIITKYNLAVTQFKSSPSPYFFHPYFLITVITTF